MSRLDQRLSERKPTATFTSNKIDIMNAIPLISALIRIKFGSFNALIYFLNGDNGKCFPSDDLSWLLLVDRARTSSRPHQIRQCGYLDWRKTGRSNRYLFNYAAAKPTLTAVKRMMAHRKERREMLLREAEEASQRETLIPWAFRR